MVLCMLLFTVILGTPEVTSQDDQQSFTQYKGDVMEGETNKPLDFATLTLYDTNISTFTNTEGGFLL
jgi:hypothetical protein